MSEIAAPLPEPNSAAEPPLFDAVLYPHRSLGRRGFRIFMSAVIAVSLALGGGFWLMGAWPVFGFMGLDVLLIFLAFRSNYRHARLSETVRLTREKLTVQRFLPDGRVRAWDFQPYWLRVEIDRPEEHDCQLSIASHGQKLIIGSFLSPEERLDFAKALREALSRCRCFPVPVT
ncbi:MAG: hypothetical protein CMM50_00890 [Rhodospirillaceae bacterium]|nr:hypothetical protein [Rhodospirillaceae bacterium]